MVDYPHLLSSKICGTRLSDIDYTEIHVAKDMQANSKKLGSLTTA